MTLVDILALVAGVASSCAVIVNKPPVLALFTPTVQLLRDLSWFAGGSALAISVVVLARVAGYRRMPSPPEWLVVFVGTDLLSDWPGRLTAPVFYSPFMMESFSPIALWWLEGVSCLVGALLGLGFFGLTRALLPAWLRTILLSWSAVLAFAGFRDLGPRFTDLLSPSGGFGPGNLAILHREACLLAGDLPAGILFGIPAMGTLAGRISGRRWTWAEWAAAICSILSVVASLMVRRAWLFDPSSGWFVGTWPAWVRGLERLLILAWFLSAASTSRWIVAHFGPAWGRWIGGGVDQDRSPASGADSAAIARPT